MSNSLFDFSNVDALGVWKDGFIVAYVTATAGVLLGVYWERDAFPQKVQEYGWDVLVKSLAVELFCGTMIFAIDGRISHVQMDKIIALETKLKPRNFLGERAKELIERLRPFGPLEYDIATPEMLEPGSFISGELVMVFSELGWKFRSYDGPLPTKPLPITIGGLILSLTRDDLISGKLLIGATSGLIGIKISFDPRYKDAWMPTMLLSIALLNEGIYAIVDSEPAIKTTDGRVTWLPVSQVVHVMIGSK